MHSTGSILGRKKHNQFQRQIYAILKTKYSLKKITYLCPSSVETVIKRGLD